MAEAAVNGAAGASAGGNNGGTGAQAAAGAAPAAAGNPGASGAGAPQGASNSAPTGGQSAGANGAGATATDWTTGLNDDYKGFVQNKGWKAPTDALESYRNLEKLVGAPQDQILKIPKEHDSPEWDGVYTRLGRPAKPEGYGLVAPKEGGNPEFTKAVSEILFKAGVSETAGKAIAAGYDQFMTAQVEAQKVAQQAKIATETEGLKKEWGAAYENNLSAGRRAARDFGIEPGVIDAIEKSVGFAKTMKFFQQIGSKLGDASFHAGSGAGGANGPMTPEQAKTQRANLMSDPSWAKRYSEGGSKERAEMERLNKYVVGES